MGTANLRATAMSPGNKRKNKQLGIPFGTAMGRLRKQLIFQLVRDCGKDICIRCGKPIRSLEEFSIDHRKPWLDTKNPVKLFYSLNNIGFSHLTCNVSTIRRHNYKGSKHPQSKLTARQRATIRRSKKPSKELAIKYGITTRNVRHIRSGG